MTHTPRTAVIGTGHWGRNLARNFHALGALAALCEVDDTARAAQAALYPEAAALAEAADIWADPAIEAVAIATPAATHGALVAQALEAGKHVFVEKPLCLDVADGARLKDRAEAAGLTLMVGHLLLYHPAFEALGAAVAEGRLGELRYLVSNRLSLGKIRREENALWSFAPHDISMILKLAGRLPDRVVSNGATFLSPSVADTTLSHLSFGDGLQAHLFVSWLHPYKDQELVVVGSQAMAVFDDVARGPDKLRLYRHRVGWDGALPAIDKAAAEPLPYDTSTEPLRNECAHFLDCVAQRRRPRSDAAEGLGVLTVLDACQRSLASGQPVDLAGPGR